MVLQIDQSVEIWDFTLMMLQSYYPFKIGLRRDYIYSCTKVRIYYGFNSIYFGCYLTQHAGPSTSFDWKLVQFTVAWTLILSEKYLMLHWRSIVLRNFTTSKIGFIGMLCETYNWRNTMTKRIRAALFSLTEVFVPLGFSQQGF